MDDPGPALPRKRCGCLTGEAERHPLFTCMFSINEAGKAQGIEFPSRISVATNPLFRAKQLNGQVAAETKGPGSKKPGKPKRTKSKKGAPYWQLDLAIGPFEKGARELKQMWADGSRKVDGRMVAGVKFASQINSMMTKSTPETAKFVVAKGQQMTIYTRDKTQLFPLLNQKEYQFKKRKKPV